MGKVNQTLNENNSILATYAMTRDSSAPLQSAFSTRARQLRLYSLDQSAQFQWTNVAAQGRWLHDFRFDFHHRNYALDSPDEGGPPLVAEGDLRGSNTPSVNITNVASFGGGRLSNEMFTRSVQGIYHSTISKGSHVIKYGVDALLLPRFDYINYTGPSSGTYSFSSLNAYLAGQYTTYTQSFGDPLLPGYHHFLSGFIQDSWAATSRLTLNYGLRYDTEFLSKHRGQLFGKDHNNFGPRFAMSYALTDDKRTLVKFGSGRVLRPNLPESASADLLRPQGRPPAILDDVELRAGGRAGVSADVPLDSSCRRTRRSTFGTCSSSPMSSPFRSRINSWRRWSTRFVMTSASVSACCTPGRTTRSFCSIET